MAQEVERSWKEKLEKENHNQDILYEKKACFQ